MMNALNTSSETSFSLEWSPYPLPSLLQKQEEETIASAKKEYNYSGERQTSAADQAVNGRPSH